MYIASARQTGDKQACAHTCKEPVCLLVCVCINHVCACLHAYTYVFVCMSIDGVHLHVLHRDLHACMQPTDSACSSM